MIQLMLISLLILGPAETLDQQGRSHDPAKPGAELTVLDFAASWCKPCWKALPKLQELAKQQPELNILVLSQDERVAGRDRLVKRLGLTVPVVWDQGHQWARRYEPEGMPATMIVDAKGEVLYRHKGSNPKDWQTFLNKLAALSARKGTD